MKSPHSGPSSDSAVDDPGEMLQAADGLALRWDSGLRLAWGESDWLGPIELATTSAPAVPLARASLEPSAGSDDLGAYREWLWRGPVVAAVRAYRQLPLLVFRLHAPTPLSSIASGDFALPSIAWPAFSPAQRSAQGSPAELRTFAFQHSEFALPVFGDAEATGFFFAPHRPGVVSPLLLIAADQRCLLLAPLDQFHEQIVAPPNAANGNSVRCGWHGDLNEVGAGFETNFAVWAAADPRTALSQWGELLLRRNSTVRLSRYADELSGRLSYWTDNGAVYYYRTAPGCDYTETLERAVADLEQKQLPIASLQLDSWFYPHEQLRPVSPEGAPIVPPTGAMTWEPRADLFPQGLSDLRRRLGNRPLTFHGRHFSSRSPYFEKYQAWTDGDYAHPQTAEFYQMLLGQAASWGAIVYEQDWMVESFFGIRPLRAAPGRARAWQEAMDAAAAEHGLHLQWCMATPADFMQSVSLSQLGSIRTSGDYRYLFDNGLNWMWFLHTNALARALGLWPYKDVFVSHGPTASSSGEPYAEIEALLAALSAGPVGLGDEIGATNPELVMRTCREDGLLLKPDLPIAATGKCFRGNRFNQPELLVGETLSQHPAGVWRYVASFNAFQGRQLLTERVELAELAASGPLLAFDWRRRSWERIESGGGWSVALEFQDWDYRILCPLLPGDLTVFGDLGKYATVADRRIGEITSTAAGVAMRLQGTFGLVVEVHGWSKHRPAAVSTWSAAGEAQLAPGDSDEGWHWDENSGLWRVRARIGRGGFTEVTIHPG